MKLDIKIKPGDEVYFLLDRRVEKAKVVNVLIDVVKSGMCIDYRLNQGSDEFRYNGEVFLTKQELADWILKQ